jgi:oligosaccharide repeat unit polymerase
MLRNPFLLFMVVWAITLALLLSASTSGVIAVGDLSTTTLLSILLSVIAWGLGHLTARVVGGAGSISRRKPPSAGVGTVSLEGRTTRILLICLLILSLIGYGAFLEAWNVFELWGRMSAAELFLLLNQEFAEESSQFGGLLGRLYVLPVIGLALTSYAAAREVIGKWAAVTLAVSFFVLLISPRRALLIQGLLLAAFIYQDARPGKRSFWSIAAVIGLSLVIFTFSQIILAKTEATIEGVLSPTVVYVAANLPVMEELLHTSHFENTQVLLNVPYRILNVLLGARYAVELDIPFVYVGVHSNTAPFQYYILRDAGFLAVIVVSFALGFAAKVTSTLAESRSTFGVVWLKSAFLVFILFSFREFTLITYDWAYFGVVALLIAYLIHRRPYVRPFNE